MILYIRYIEDLNKYIILNFILDFSTIYAFYINTKKINNKTIKLN